MSRFVRLCLLLLCLTACGREPGDASANAADTDVAVSSEGVSCPNLFKPAKTLTCEGSTPVCCLKGQLMSPLCAADVKACGQDSRLACDDALDCGGGQSCCLMELNSGGQKFIGTCKARCTLLEKPMCSAADTCAVGQICCIGEGDVWGTCVKDGQGCPVDTSR